MRGPIGYAAGVGERDILSSIDFALKHGMKGVEVNLNMPCFFPENYTTEARKRINQYRQEKDVTLSIHAPEDISLLHLHTEVREAGIRRLKEIIDFAVDIGASRMTMHVGSSPYFTMTDGRVYFTDLHYEEFKMGLYKSLNELADYCGNRLYLCVENSGHFPQKLVQEVLEELLVDKKLYLTWDIGHSYSNLYNEVEFFLRHLDRVKTCHLHDVNDKSDHQVIGTGKVDFVSLFDKLKDQDVVYIIEVRPKEKAAESYQKLIKLLN